MPTVYPTCPINAPGEPPLNESPQPPLLRETPGKNGGVWRYAYRGLLVGGGRGNPPRRTTDLLPVYVDGGRSARLDLRARPISARLIALAAKYSAIIECVLSAPTDRQDMIRLGAVRLQAARVVQANAAVRALREAGVASCDQHSSAPVLVLRGTCARGRHVDHLPGMRRPPLHRGREERGSTHVRGCRIRQKPHRLRAGPR